MAGESKMFILKQNNMLLQFICTNHACKKQTLHAVINANKEGDNYVITLKCTLCSEPHFKWISDTEDAKIAYEKFNKRPI